MGIGPSVVRTNMNERMQKEIKAFIANAYRKHCGTFKNNTALIIAEVQGECEREYGRRWHCVDVRGDVRKIKSPSLRADKFIELKYSGGEHHILLFQNGVVREESAQKMDSKEAELNNLRNKSKSQENRIRELERELLLSRQYRQMDDEHVEQDPLEVVVAVQQTQIEELEERMKAMTEAKQQKIFDVEKKYKHLLLMMARSKNSNETTATHIQ